MVKPLRGQPAGAGKAKEILTSSVALLKSDSLTNWSIDGCARRAHCAKGLVIHYFKGRAGLLEATAAELVRERARSWPGSIASGGVAGLDQLWERLVLDAGDGSARAIIELRLAGVAGASLLPADAITLQGTLARALETSLDHLPSPAALEPILEGYLLALIAGGGVDAVRNAFFGYWLSCVE